MAKKRHGAAKYPEIEEKLRSGEYTLREATGRKNTCRITWSQIRYIQDEQGNEINNFFCCGKCSFIFNLELRNSGRVLKRHVQSQCRGQPENTISNYFSAEYQEAKKRKIKPIDKVAVRGASVGFVIRDMRPISAINGEGLMQLMATMTSIGAKYGELSISALDSLKLVPSRQTVRL